MTLVAQAIVSTGFKASTPLDAQNFYYKTFTHMPTRASFENFGFDRVVWKLYPSIPERKITRLSASFFRPRVLDRNERLVLMTIMGEMRTEFFTIFNNAIYTNNRVSLSQIHIEWEIHR